MVGTFGHRRGDGIRNPDQIRPRVMSGAGAEHAYGRIGRKTDHHDGLSRTEGAEIEILWTGAANQLHLVGPKQAKLVIEQFGDAAAAAKSRDPDAPRRMQRASRARHRLRRDARQPGGFGSQLVRNEGYVDVRTRPPPAGASREGGGLRGPSRFSERGPQFVPTRIADGLGKAGK